MKKIFFIISILTSLIIVPAALADSWDDISNIDTMWNEQKSITNQEFEQVVNALEEKKKTQEENKIKKKRKKLFGKGSTLHEELSPDGKIQEIDSLEPKEDLLLSIPVNIILEDHTLDKGFYKILPNTDKETGKKYVKFYQSQFYKGKVEVIETQDDFAEKDLNFVKLIPYNDSFVKIIFGSLDFNGYAFIPYIKN